MGESEERGGSQGGFNVGESEERGGQKPMSKSKFLCTGGWVHAALALSVDGTPSLVPFCPLFCRKCGGFQLQQHRKKISGGYL